MTLALLLALLLLVTAGGAAARVALALGPTRGAAELSRATGLRVDDDPCVSFSESRSSDLAPSGDMATSSASAELEDDDDEEDDDEDDEDEEDDDDDEDDEEDDDSELAASGVVGGVLSITTAGPQFVPTTTITLLPAPACMAAAETGLCMPRTWRSPRLRC